MQGSRGSQSVVEALEHFQSGLSSLFANANDCHDDRGQFCEGGGTGGGALGRAARDHERMRRDDALPGGARLGMEARESLRVYTDKALRAAPPGEREAIDYDRHQLGKEPIDWKRIDAKPPKPTGGIGPEASVHTAEKRGKEYGYAKKVSFYQCTNVDQANEINTQMAELSDDSGLVVDRVFVYKGGGKSKEAPKNAAGYHQGSTQTIGFQDGNTAEYCFKNAPYAPGAQEKNAQWFFDYADKMESEHLSGEREKVDPEIVRAFRKQGEEALLYKDYQAHTIQGNGVRNPTVDHEFAHALVTRAIHTKPISDIEVSSLGYGSKEAVPDWYRVNDVAAGRVEALGQACRAFAKEEKFSVYAVTGQNLGKVPSGEAIAETYAHWKAGKTVPPKIATGLRRLETYRGQGTGT